MADYQAIAAASRSLERFLSHCFTDEQPVPSSPCSAVLVRTEDLASSAAAQIIGSPALSVYLYKVDLNKSMRAAWSSVGNHDQRGHLPLDLHFLLTAWADNAFDELRILGRTMQCLEETPILGGPLLDSSGGWSAGEALQICLEDLSTEDVMRTFDSLPADFKLSVCYLARVVRIDSPVQQRHTPVTTLASGATPIEEPAV